MIEHILLAVADQGSAAEQVRLCTDVALATGASVTVFHARRMAHGRGGPRPVETRPAAEQLVDDVAFLLLVQGVPVAGRRVGTSMEHPSEQIVRTAREVGASVVLLGRARGGPLLNLLRRARLLPERRPGRPDPSGEDGVERAVLRAVRRSGAASSRSSRSGTGPLRSRT